MNPLEITFLVTNTGIYKTAWPLLWNLSPNLMNLSRVSNPPKTGFNCAHWFETLNTILSGTNHIWAAFKFKPRLKFFKYLTSQQIVSIWKKWLYWPLNIFVYRTWWWRRTKEWENIRDLNCPLKYDPVYLYRDNQVHIKKVRLIFKQEFFPENI